MLEGRFVVLPREKVYAAVAVEDPIPRDDDENFPDLLLHTDPMIATYQTLGDENVGDRNAKKYRIVVNNPADKNVSQSETFMWIDETLTMPVKSETKTADGTRITMELSDIVLEPAKQLFQIPANFEKIPFRDLRKQLKSRRLNP